VLAKQIETETTPVRLPAYEEVRNRIRQESSTTAPELVRRRNLAVRVGASERTADVPLDRELHRSRILGGRQPVVPRVEVQPTDSTPRSNSTPRRPVGAVERPSTPRVSSEDRRGRESGATRRTDEVDSSVPNVVTPRRESPRSDQPQPTRRPSVETRTPPRADTPSREVPTPRSDVQRPTPQPRRESPRPVERPRNDPPVRNDPPARPVERPRNDRPARNNPPARPVAPQRKADPPKQDRPAPRTDARPTRKPESLSQ